MRSISLLIILILILIAICTFAQQTLIDSLKQALNRADDDSTKFCLLVEIGELSTFNNADSSFNYIKKATVLADDKKNPLWKAHTCYAASLYFLIASDFASALNFSFKNINEVEQYHDPYVYTISTHMLATVYGNSDFHEQALAYAFKTISFLDTMN